MSKRLKLQLGGEAEMEERAFANPYPDYQPQGAAAAHGAVEAHRDRALLPPAAEDPLPFGADGKVSAGEEPPCAPPGLLPAGAARGLRAGRAGRRARLAAKWGAVPGRGAPSPETGAALLRYRLRPVRVRLGRRAEGRGAAERLPAGPSRPSGVAAAL